MFYTKQNFQNGQVLKVEQLNYIEDGIASLLTLHESDYLIRYTRAGELYLIDKKYLYISVYSIADASRHPVEGADLDSAISANTRYELGTAEPA